MTYEEIANALRDRASDPAIVALEQIITYNLELSREHEFLAHVEPGIRDYSAGSSANSVELLNILKALTRNDGGNSCLDLLKFKFTPIKKDEV